MVLEQLLNAQLLWGEFPRHPEGWGGGGSSLAGLAQPLHHFPLRVWRQWELSKHLQAGEAIGPTCPEWFLLPPHTALPVALRFLQDLQGLLFARQCLNLLGGSSGDVRQSCSFPVKICKHGQIWGLSGEHQSQVTLSPAQQPRAGGTEVWRNSCFTLLLGNVTSLGLEHVLAGDSSASALLLLLRAAWSLMVQPFVCF